MKPSRQIYLPRFHTLRSLKWASLSIPHLCNPGTEGGDIYAHLWVTEGSQGSLETQMQSSHLPGELAMARFYIVHFPRFIFLPY